MRNTTSAFQISSGVIDDQIVGIDAFRHRTLTQWAIVNLLERSSTKAKHKQHSVGVRIIFLSCRCQIMIKILFHSICHLIASGRPIVGIVTDLNGAISRKQFRTSISLKTQYGFEQERMANFRHAFDRSAVCRSLKSWNFNLETKQLDTLRPFFNPFTTAFKIRINPTHQIVSNPAEFDIVDIVGKIGKPTFRLGLFGFFYRFPIERDANRTVRMFNA